MRFRSHAGDLADSMKTVVELEPTTEALREHLRLKPWLNAELPIKVEPYYMQPDERIGWPHTYIVTVDGFGAVGFTDSPVDHLQATSTASNSPT